MRGTKAVKIKRISQLRPAADKTIHQLYTMPPNVLNYHAKASHSDDLIALSRILLFHVSLQPTDTRLIEQIDALRQARINALRSSDKDEDIKTIFIDDSNDAATSKYRLAVLEKYDRPIYVKDLSDNIKKIINGTILRMESNIVKQMNAEV